MRIKEMVKDAIATHHTFMIYGRARVVRECMLKRGWCEKYFRKNSTGTTSLFRKSFSNRLFRTVQNIDLSSRTLHYEFESCRAAGRYRRLEGPAKRTTADLQDAQQSHRRFPLEHRIRLARLAVPGQQSYHLQQILPGGIHVEGISELASLDFRRSRDACVSDADDTCFLRDSTALGGPVFERQADALVLRGWRCEHPLPAMLQSLPGRSDARLHRGLPVSRIRPTGFTSVVESPTISRTKEPSNPEV